MRVSLTSPWRNPGKDGLTLFAYPGGAAAASGCFLPALVQYHRGMFFAPHLPDDV
jgi:hypothetical protein